MRRVDGEAEQRLGHLLGVRAIGLLHGLGEERHADIALDRPRRRVLLLGVLGEAVRVVPVGGRVPPVEGVVGIAPDADGIVLAHGLGGLGRARLAHADEVVLDGVEVAEGLGLLGEGDEVAAPERGEHRLRLLGHLRVDERRVVRLAELRPLLVDDRHARLDLLQVLDEGLGHVLAIGVVGADRGDLGQRPLGHDLRGAAPFHGGVRGDAEDVGVELVGGGELVRLRDGRDEDDLVLLGDDRDRGALRRGERAHEEVDVLLQDQLAGDAHRLVGIALGVAREQLDLAAEHAALGVQLVHVHLGALERGLAEERARSGEDHGEADLDRLLGLGGERRRQGQSEQHGQKAQQHGVPPLALATRNGRRRSGRPSC